jgi:hypothetical protein
MTTARKMCTNTPRIYRCTKCGTKHTTHDNWDICAANEDNPFEPGKLCKIKEEKTPKEKTSGLCQRCRDADKMKHEEQPVDASGKAVAWW